MAAVRQLRDFLSTDRRIPAMRAHRGSRQREEKVALSTQPPLDSQRSLTPNARMSLRSSTVWPRCDTGTRRCPVRISYVCALPRRPEALGYAGLTGEVMGETMPSSSGVTGIVGQTNEDYAINLWFEEREEQVWFAPHLLEPA